MGTKSTRKPTHLTTGQAADRLHVKPQTLREWRHRGVGPAFLRIGANRCLYPIKDLLVWEESNRKERRAKDEFFRNSRRCRAVKEDGQRCSLTANLSGSCHVHQTPARLIAAAPDLLAAAKLVLAHGAATHHDSWDTDLAELAHAVAKAEGR